MEDEGYSREYIGDRLKVMLENTGGPEKMEDVLSRMAYEFGVDNSKYRSEMSEAQIVSITYDFQTHICQSYLDIVNEAEQYESLR